MDAQPSENEKNIQPSENETNAQPSETRKKRKQAARWNKPTKLIFCDVCIKAIEKGMRPGTHFSSDGWDFVKNTFNATSKEKFNRLQLKNKWDLLKKQWKIWKELIGKETGLGWDPRRRIIDATEEWWDQKLKVVPGASKFRKGCLEPDLLTD